MSIDDRYLKAALFKKLPFGGTMNSITNQAQRKRWNSTSFLKLIILASAISSGGIFSQVALAACTISGPIDRLIDNPANGWEVQVDGSVPMGSFLKLITFSGSSPEIAVTCDAEGVRILVDSEYPIVGTSGGVNLYDSGIPGIAFGLFLNDLDISGKLPLEGIIPTTTTSIRETTLREIALFKTGEISTGGQILPSHIAAKALVLNHDSLNILNLRLARPITVTILRPTCTVSRPNFNVDLGTVSVVDFNSSGRTTPKTFSIDLNCTGGSGARDVHVTLTDANNPGNATSQLNLSPDSDALGIALEVNNRHGLVNFGPDLSGTGNPGQWLDGAASVGSYSIPLSVNYVRLPGPIKGGSANSGVTYTLNYD